MVRFMGLKGVVLIMVVVKGLVHMFGTMPMLCRFYFQTLNVRCVIWILNITKGMMGQCLSVYNSLWEENVKISDHVSMGSLVESLKHIGIGKSAVITTG